MIYTYPFNDYRSYLIHHGVKGQRKGVRNGPPYPLKRTPGGMIIRRKITGHTTTPTTSNPNTVDDYYKNGNVDKRVYYDENGLMSKQIHANDHNRPKYHDGAHVLVFERYEDGTIKRKYSRKPNAAERKENSDIL